MRDAAGGGQGVTRSQAYTPTTVWLLLSLEYMLHLDYWDAAARVAEVERIGDAACTRGSFKVIPNITRLSAYTCVSTDRIRTIYRKCVVRELKASPKPKPV